MMLLLMVVLSKSCALNRLEDQMYGLAVLEVCFKRACLIFTDLLDLDLFSNLL